jgi:hypothetical protein
MKIDITPTIEEGTEFDKIVMKGRDLEALYVFRTFENKEYTVKFDKNSIAEFQPNTTVSAMMTSWEENIDRRIKVIEKALRTKRHPYQKEMVVVPNEFEYRYGSKVPKMEEGKKKRKLEQREIDGFKTSLEILATEVGKLSFIKIV